MQYESIERELHIEASPEIVYQVVSSPEHIQGWWPDGAQFERVPGATGTIRFGDASAPDAKVVAITVVEADPPRRFAFRWVYDEGEVAAAGNSLLVTFDLVPAGTGTRLQFTETGFRERGWEPTVVEDHYLDHARGWDHFLSRLAPYVDRLVAEP